MMEIGEILEKATRTLTDEEKAQLEVDFVGKNGQRRKLEVRHARISDHHLVADTIF